MSTVGVHMLLWIGSLVQNVSNTEAVKKVEEDGSRVRDSERISVLAQRDRPMNDIHIYSMLQ